jgi:hypothetical protein
MATQEEEDEYLHYEVLRVRAVRKKKGVTEGSLIRAVQACYWVDAKAEADEDDSMSKDGKSFFRDLRRVPMWKCLLKLWNEGYTPAEPARSLKINYSTAYYYFKKFEARQKPRGWNEDRFRVNPETMQIERMKEPPKEYRARLKAKKLAIRKAHEKRARKAEKMRATHEKQLARQQLAANG